MAAHTINTPDFDTILDVLGTILLAYLGWLWTGGVPIPFLAEVVPFIGATAFGIVAWRVFRKNNA